MSSDELFDLMIDSAVSSFVDTLKSFVNPVSVGAVSIIGVVLLIFSIKHVYTSLKKFFNSVTDFVYSEEFSDLVKCPRYRRERFEELKDYFKTQWAISTYKYNQSKKRRHRRRYY